MYKHRKRFGLTYEEALNEPLEQILISDKIESFINERKALDAKPSKTNQPKGRKT